MENERRIFTIPNLLSLLRIVLVVFFEVYYFTDRKSLAFAVLIVSCLTDTVDGWIARRFHQISELGKVLDPVADKLFTVSTLLTLCIGGTLKWWYVAALFFKEALMLVGGAVFIGSTGRVIAARWYGKVTTVVVFTTMLYAMFVDAAGLFRVSDVHAVSLVSNCLLGLCLVGLVLAYYSLIRYGTEAIRIFRETKSGKEN